MDVLYSSTSASAYTTQEITWLRSSIGRLLIVAWENSEFTVFPRYYQEPPDRTPQPSRRSPCHQISRLPRVSEEVKYVLALTNNKENTGKAYPETSHSNLGAGDSYLVLDVLPDDLANIAFQKLEEEVRWNIMHHRGRPESMHPSYTLAYFLSRWRGSEIGCSTGRSARRRKVNTQSWSWTNEKAFKWPFSFPIYRHPADESPALLPFSSTVGAIREHVQRVINHPVNHVLIQFYRTGADFISEHSDKTIDVVRGSRIVNISIGAQRTMTLRMKKDRAQLLMAQGEAFRRPTQRFPLPHNSMFVMGPETNAKWLHAINHDKGCLKTKSEPERREGGARISLTFRHIGTFLTQDQTRIYGQGAKGKTAEDAGQVVNGTHEAEQLIMAFGKENHESDFDWDGNYGAGFDVLHFTVRE